LGLKIKKGMIQDATFITADPGYAPADKPPGDQARTRGSKETSLRKRIPSYILGLKSIPKMTVTMD